MHFIDLHAQQLRLKKHIDAGISDVLSSGSYILGPQVLEFEDKIAAFGKASHAVSCANGTDAILLPLMAWGIGSGDAVFCPSFTYCATAEVIALLGATPVFIDIDRETYNMDIESLKEAITQIKKEGNLIPRAVIAVDLFGQSANYNTIEPVVRENNMKLISDSAQGFGTTLNGKHPLAWADVQTTSFFPAKPLGCYGDGGAIMTDNDELANILKSIRVHGKGKDKYDNIRVGMNSRLDTLQAAILLPKLAIFSDEIKNRNKIAMRYAEGLSEVVNRIPVVLDGVISTWAQYTIEVPNPLAFASSLKSMGIPTARYYPKPVHMQTAYLNYPISGNNLKNTMACIENIISLPMHPYLTLADQSKVISAAKTALL